jgi:hypothetical protein
MQGSDRLTVDNIGREPPDNKADDIRCPAR